MTKKWLDLEDIFTGQMDSRENNRYICGRECELYAMCLSFLTIIIITHFLTLPCNFTQYAQIENPVVIVIEILECLAQT